MFWLGGKLTAVYNNLARLFCAPGCGPRVEGLAWSEHLWKPLGHDRAWTKGTWGHLTWSPRPSKACGPYSSTSISLSLPHMSETVSRCEGPSVCRDRAASSGRVSGTQTHGQETWHPDWSAFSLFQLDKGPETRQGEDSGELKAQHEMFPGRGNALLTVEL